MPRNPNKQRCGATKTNGRPCSRWARRGSDPPLCNLHGEDSLPGEAAEAQGRRCTAKTAAGTRCPNWAMHNGVPPLCSVHAGLTVPALEDSRRCSAMTSGARRGGPGAQCRSWATLESDPPLCTIHAGRFLPDERQEAGEMASQMAVVTAGRRCTAVKVDGEQCRNWASRNWTKSNKPEGPARVGPALCSIHAGRRRLPGQEDEAAGRRCSARTKAGERCPNWAKLDSIAKQGRPMCSTHTREVHWRWPGPRERAAGRGCTATTIAGKRCRHWAAAGSDPPLCWIHAYPDQHHRIRHGYYRTRPALSEVEWAAIEFLIASGRDLDAAILITKIQVRAILEYLNKPDRPVAEDINSFQLIFRSCSRIGKLQLARKELEMARPGKEPDWVAATLKKIKEA